MDKMIEGWWQSNPGYEFENQSKLQVRNMIFEFLDDESIPYSTTAVANAADVRGRGFGCGRTFDNYNSEVQRNFSARILGGVDFTASSIARFSRVMRSSACSTSCR
jgi:hypothetical protein